MKLRYKILIACSIVCLFSVGIYFGAIHFIRSTKVKEIIQKEISQKLGEYIHINDARIGFGNISIDEIRVLLNKGEDSLYIKEIQIGWSAFEFIKSRFHPQQGITLIKIKEPQVYLGAVLNDSLVAHSSSGDSVPRNYIIQKRDYLVSLFEKSLNQLFDTFNNVEKLEITNGSFYYSSNQKKWNRVAHNTNIELIVNQNNAVSLSANASLYDYPQNNLHISGVVNKQNYSFSADIELTNYNVTYGLKDLLKDKITVQEGTINTKIHFAHNLINKEQGEYKINGFVRIENASLKTTHPELELSSINVYAVIQQNTITIESFTQSVAGGTVDIKGTIYAPFDFDLDLSAQVTNVDIAKFKNTFNKESINNSKWQNDLAGVLSGSLEITGKLLNPEITGMIYADSLIAHSITFYQVSSSVSFSYPLIMLHTITAEYRDITITAATELDLKNINKINVIGDLKGNLQSILSNFPQISKNAYSGEAKFEINGTTKNIFGKGDFLLSSTNEKGLKTINGSYAIADSITFQGKSSDNDFAFKGVLTRDISTYYIELSNALPLIQHEFNIPKEVSDYAQNINLTVSGNKHEAKISALAFSGKSDSLFAFNGIYQIREGNKGLLIAELSIPIQGKIPIVISSEVIHEGNKYFINKIISAGLFTGYGEIVQNDSTSINGTLEINSTIEYLKTFIPYELLDKGQITGEVFVKGTFKEPNITGRVSLINGNKNIISGLSGNCTFSADQWTNFKIPQISLLSNDFQLLSGTAEIDFKNDIKTIAFEGRRVPPKLINAFFNIPSEIVRSDVTYKLEYSKNFSFEGISGTVSAPLCKFGPITVSDISVELGSNGSNKQKTETEAENTGTLFSGVMVKEFKATVSKNISVQGDGFIGFSNKKQSDFNISLTGNLLSVFTELDPFFKFAACTSKATIAITGSVRDPSIGSGNIKITNGELHLQSISRKITNIYLDAELQPDSRFVEIKRLEADLDGKHAWINNIPGVTLGDTLILSPLELMEDGLNLGVLTLHTGNKGIDLILPSLMPKDEKATVQFKGFNEKEQFYFAGGTEADTLSTENPYVRGKILMKDGRIDYPKEIITVSEPGIVQKYLENINWDVLVIPESNNFYARKEPFSSYYQSLNDLFGDTKIELKIEDSPDGLHFRGAFNDEEGILFDVTGNLLSHRGIVETRLARFEVENFELYFNKARPYIKGIARTSVKDPESLTGANVDIYAILVSEEIDSQGKKTGKLLDYGTWDDKYEPNFYFKLSDEPSVSNHVIGSQGPETSKEIPEINRTFTTEGKILEYFGITPQSLIQTGTKVAYGRVGDVISSYLFDKWTKTLRDIFKLNELRMQTHLQQKYEDIGLLQKNVQMTQTSPLISTLFNPKYLFLSPEWRMGKYLSPSLYLVYEGQYVRTIREQQKNVVGMNHVVSLQYRLPNKVAFEFEYDYDFYRFLNRGDLKFWFHHQIQLVGLAKK